MTHLNARHSFQVFRPVIVIYKNKELGQIYGFQFLSMKSFFYNNHVTFYMEGHD